MTHLLHLDASARTGSYSRELGEIFVAEWRAAHPDATYTHRDLVARPALPLDEARVELSARSGLAGVQEIAAMDEVAASARTAAAWAVTRPLVEELLAADVLLIGTPMYNYSVPAALKAWIDQVTFPWLRLADTSVVVLSARGGAYGPGTPREPFDFQETYLRAYLTAIGVRDMEFVHTELTYAPVLPALAEFRELHEGSRAGALQAVRALATRTGAGLASRA